MAVQVKISISVVDNEVPISNINIDSIFCSILSAQETVLDITDSISETYRGLIEQSRAENISISA